MIAIPAAVTLLVVVIEAAHLWLAKLELQNALNAAALAGVKTWAEASEADHHAAPGAFAKTHAGRVAAIAAANANTVSGNPVLLNANETPDDGNNTTGFENDSCTGDILLGGFPTSGSNDFDTSTAVSCGTGTDIAFGVLVQKTMAVTPICSQIFGVPLTSPNVRARALATARCQGGGIGDYVVLNPQGVHITQVTCP